jgi:response regulator of citrate/malate metabolism
MRAIIVEDEVMSGDLLEELLNQYCPHVKVVGRAASLAQARDAD